MRIGKASLGLVLATAGCLGALLVAPTGAQESTAMRQVGMVRTGAGTFTMDVEGADIRTVLRAIAEFSGKNIAFTTINMPLVKTPMIAPTKLYNHVPTLTPEQAADLVVEAIVENLEVKRALFRELEAIVGENAILASNTSSLRIAAIAAACKRPERVAGLHFFNPVPLMKLVEVVRTILTDDAVATAATEFVRSVGKVPVQAKDATAFIVNRLLVPYLLDAIRVYEGGLASLEDIDAAMKLGCGYPMGPFTLLDLVGLDTTMFVADVMFEEFREPRYAPPPLLKRMVMAGHLGRKTGRGFYTYESR